MSGSWRRSRGRIGVTLVGLELGTGLAALAGGALLMVKPDGSLIQARPSALAHSPFRSWSLPGLLLAVLIGGGFTLTALWQRHGGRFAEMLSLAAGIGIVAFEVVEMAWIGFQALEALFAGVGVAVTLLAVSGRRQRRRLHRAAT